MCVNKEDLCELSVVIVVFLCICHCVFEEAFSSVFSVLHTQIGWFDKISYIILD